MPPVCANDREWNEIELRLWRVLFTPEKLLQIMATQSELTARLTALAARTDQLTAAVTALAANAGQASPEITAAVNGLEVAVGHLSDAAGAAPVVPPVVPPVTPLPTS